MIQHDLLKTAEVAQLCRVTPKTVSIWFHKGELPGIQLPSGELRFRREVVESLLSPTVADEKAEKAAAS